MNNTHRSLLQLLSISLGNENKFCCSTENNDWENIYFESRHQGVSGIVLDSINSLSSSSRPNSKLLLEWIGDAVTNERRYLSYADTISRLTAIAEGLGMKMLVLKGYGCSLNYPVPNHRPCGDIDVYLLDDNWHHSEDLSRHLEDYLYQEYGICVCNKNGHHSQFNFGEFLVENHSFILDIDAHKSSEYLEELLEGIIAEGIPEVTIDGRTFYFPPSRFNSIHLLRHMANDFATVRTTLRHVLDWSTFVASNSLDWTFVREIAHKTNMNRFLDALNGICVDYLGYQEERFPIEHRDLKLENKVLDSILTSQDSVKHPSKYMSFPQRLCYGLSKAKRMWNNRWKYKIVYNESLLQSFFRKVKQF